MSGGDGEDRQTAGKRRKKEKEGEKLKNGTSLVEVLCLTEQHRVEGAPPS